MGPPPTLSRHLGNGLLKTAAAVLSQMSWLSITTWLSFDKEVFWNQEFFQFSLILHSLNNYWVYPQWHSSEEFIPPMWEGNGNKSLRNLHLVDFRFFAMHAVENLLWVGNFFSCSGRLQYYVPLWFWAVAKPQLPVSHLVTQASNSCWHHTATLHIINTFD